MDTLAIATVVFVCCFGAALAGMILHAKLPDEHLDAESKDVVKLVMALVATLAALVLSLLIASSNSYYNTQAAEIRQGAADILQLDEMLSLYCSETREARANLKRLVIAEHQRVWPLANAQAASLDPSLNRGLASELYQKMLSLSPTTEAQRISQSTALQLLASLRHLRVLMFEQLEGSISWVFLTVLVFWVAMLFLGFGLLARFHVTITVTLIVGALSVAGAVFLIVELSQPYSGLLRVSDGPIRNALARIDR